MKHCVGKKTKKKIRSFFRNEHGNVTLIVATSMVALIGVVGLVIDLGKIYLERSDLKKEATTAVLSASQELTNSEDRVNGIISNIMNTYNDGSALENTQIEMDKQVTVSLKKYVPYSFMSIFGLNGMTVHAEATAKIQPIGSMTGVVPLGIDQSINLVYGQTYTLKVGAGDSTIGNFGILALEGPGANNYNDALRYGFDQPLNVGDIINTQTGNMDGPTSDAVSYRIANCPYPEGETYHRDCARIMPIIIYTPESYRNNQLASVKITGFAFFYLLDPGEDPSVINGVFIKRVDNGTFQNNSLDKGAYTARLIE